MWLLGPPLVSRVCLTSFPGTMGGTGSPLDWDPATLSPWWPGSASPGTSGPQGPGTGVEGSSATGLWRAPSSPQALDGSRGPALLPLGAGPRERPLGTAKDGWGPRGTLTAVTAPRSPRARSGSERRPLPSAAPGWGAACAPIPAYPCPSAAVHSCCGTGLGAALACPPAPPLAPPRRHGVSGAGLGTRGGRGRPGPGPLGYAGTLETASWDTETQGGDGDAEAVATKKLGDRDARVTGQGALGTKAEAENIKSSRDSQMSLPHRGRQGPRSSNCGDDVFIRIPEHRSGHEGYCETRGCWWCSGA